MMKPQLPVVGYPCVQS